MTIFAVALMWWPSGRCVMRSVSCSAAGLAAKRTPAPGQAAGAVDLPGVLTTASRVRVRIIGTLALQCLAELALVLILGTIRLRRGVSHADLLPGRRYPQLRTCDSRMPPGRVGGGDRRRVLPTKPAACAAGAGACPASSVTHLPASQEVAGDIHLFFAAATFAMLGLIALRFAKSGRTSRLVNDSRDLPRHDCR